MEYVSYESKTWLYQLVCKDKYLKNHEKRLIEDNI